MPLRVNCPNGCVFRVPSSRAGKIVRCPNCKTAVRINPVSKPKSHIAKSIVVNDDAIESPFEFRIDLHNVTTGDSSKSQDEIVVHDPVEINPITVQPTADQLAGRLERSRGDRILLSRFIAVFILGVGVVNLAPAAYHWYLWSQDTIALQIPRWTYIQIFVAGLHLIYAILVLQVTDWSSLKAVSVVMLAVAAIFGFVSAGLILGSATSPMAVFLGLQHSMVRTATIWCVAMLLLAIVTSYVSVKESLNWQRIEKIIQEFVPQDTQA